MSGEHGALPSTAHHCELCGFHEVKTPESPIVIADEGVAVQYFVNEAQLAWNVTAEMHQNLSPQQILEAKFCAYCIRAGLCRSFTTIPDDLNPELEMIVKRTN